MNIEYKIKRTTLETAINFLMINGSKSIKRTARNILEVGCDLSKSHLSEEVKDRIFKELVILIEDGNVHALKSFAIETFIG